MHRAPSESGEERPEMNITFSSRTIDVAIDHADNTTDIYMVPIELPIGLALAVLIIGWIGFRKFRKSN